MIWALLAIYFLGGGVGSGSMLTSGGVKQLSARTEVVIENPGRAKAAQQTLAKLRKEAKAFEKVFSKSGKKLKKSYKDHDASVGQARVILEDLNSSWKYSQQRALDLRFELKESMTGEEWAALFSTE